MAFFKQLINGRNDFAFADFCDDKRRRFIMTGAGDKAFHEILAKIIFVPMRFRFYCEILRYNVKQRLLYKTNK